MEEYTKELITILIAGTFSLGTLLGSRLCSLLNRRNYKKTSDVAYECGFKGKRLVEYISDKYNLISIYLLLELILIYCLTIFLL